MAGPGRAQCPAAQVLGRTGTKQQQGQGLHRLMVELAQPTNRDSARDFDSCGRGSGAGGHRSAQRRLCHLQGQDGQAKGLHQASLSWDCP